MSSTLATKLVNNKFITSSNNYKTQMCKSILNNISCAFGEKCRFAHSKEELRQAPCFFGRNCNNPRCQKSHNFDETEQEKIINDLDKKLKFIEETNVVIKLDEPELEIVEYDDYKSVLENKMLKDKSFDEDSFLEKEQKDIMTDVISYENSDEYQIKFFEYMKKIELEQKTFKNIKIEMKIDLYRLNKLEFFLKENGINFFLEEK